MNKVGLALKIILSLLIILILFIDLENGLKIGIAVVFFSVLIIDELRDNKRIKR